MLNEYGDRCNGIQKIAEALFYGVSTIAVIKKTWFDKKKHNGGKKERKHKSKR